MSEAFASGQWRVQEGAEAAFVERWQAFLDWTAAEAPGLRWARLLNDAGDPRHFVSVAQWCCPTHRAEWKARPEFARLVGACRELCTEYHGSDYSLAASVLPLQEAQQ